MCSSPLPSPSTVSVPDGHIALILLHREHSSFYLQIPLDTIHSLCLKPRKYLLFLGWCILGVEGGLALDHGGSDVDTHEGLDNQGIYYYVTSADSDFSQAIDLEVIKVRTNVPSDTTQTREDFRNRLLERDACCMWTGAEEEFGSGLQLLINRFSTRNIVNILVKYTINTGSVLMVGAVLEVIGLVLWSHSLAFIGIFQIQTQLYANCFVTNLNARSVLRKELQRTPIVTLSTSDQSKTQTSAVGIKITNDTFVEVSQDPRKSEWQMDTKFAPRSPVSPV